MICSLTHDCDCLLVNQSMILAVCEKLFAFESHVLLASSCYPIECHKVPSKYPRKLWPIKESEIEVSFLNIEDKWIRYIGGTL